MQKPQMRAGHIETSDSDARRAFCMHKITGEVWDPQRLVILVLKSSFCKQKTTGEGWNPYRLVILVLKLLF